MIVYPTEGVIALRLGRLLLPPLEPQRRRQQLRQRRMEQ